MAEVVELDGDNWDTEVMQSPLPVLVDCWATWCGPCALMEPEVAALADQEQDRLRVAKIDVDAFPFLMQLVADIDLLPTCLLFVNGELAHTIPGFHAKDELLWEIEPFLKRRKMEQPPMTSLTSEY
ncbi:MAG TPA: thioredoxin domain-containing protein [Actinomycetota bacterium]|nr:thioredoxin domain-containing protein [Actinomycetota bacterium]